MSSIPERYTTDRSALAAALKQLRETRFATGSDAARALGWSQPKMSKIENGRVLPSVDDVEQLLDLCNAPAAHRGEVLDLASRLHSTIESNRTILRRGAARKQSQIAQIESDATVLRYFSPSVIPGLLQTAEYMRRMFSLELTGDDLASAVRARTERQQALYGSAKRFTFLITENALRWRFAPDEVMAAQLGHIATLSTLNNVTVGVITLSSTVADVPLHGFEIFDDRLVTIGLEHATVTVTEPRDIAIYTRMHDALASAAVYGEDARATLTELIQVTQH